MRLKGYGYKRSVLQSVDKTPNLVFMYRPFEGPRNDDAPRVTAVLGPTNTGKTHLAVERMLGHRSGMIGLPLRLLAREIYDRVVARAGVRAVALITGEEKLVPEGARYFVSTVESMPLERPVAFLAVDEIQLCADRQRGHVFTERLLHARGREETMFLGAETIRPLMRRLAPGIDFVTRPRFSTLRHAAPRKLTRLAPRSVVVAFSAQEVYALAETLRRQCGGAAVVLGALSPRTRNAQVALYQAGEVDYLVATDAIGMGLNMDVDHVAFAAHRKFDGRILRDLTSSEVAQIAGRAGRHMNDGSFGVTADADGFAPEVIEAVEAHRFEDLKTLCWRNPRLEFSSLSALLRSLDQPPPSRGLVRAADAEDSLALKALAKNDAIAALASHPDAVRLLWEVCRIPDYRKILADAHVSLLGGIYRHLRAGDGRLPVDWVAPRVARLDRIDGDIDTLVGRIAHIRTWTYISHCPGWLPDAAHWQGRTREIEDRLSDALHESLTQRFVDRRTAVLLRGLKRDDRLRAEVAECGEVTVEGYVIGRLAGFRFSADRAGAPFEGKALEAAARRALKPEIASRVTALIEGGNDDLAIDGDARLIWRGAAIARLAAGRTVLAPRLELIASDLLTGAASARLVVRLEAWLAGHIGRRTRPLARLADAALTGPARGLAYQLMERLGSMPRRGAAREINALAPSDRAALSRLGVRIGRQAVYLSAMLKPAPRSLRALLWAVHAGWTPVPRAPAGEALSVALDAALPRGFYAAIGYRPLGCLALRLDAVERILARGAKLSRAGPFAPTAGMAALAGCDAESFGGVLVGLGYRAEAPDGQGIVFYSPPARGRRAKRRRRRDSADPGSPFAKLAALRVAAP